MFENLEIKVLHIGELPFPLPWEEWYSKIEKAFHVKVSFEKRDHLSGDKKSIEGYHLVRLSPSFVHEAYLLFSATPPLLSILQSVDFIYKKDHQLWPQLLFKEGLHSAILMKHPTLNIKGAGLIIGSSTEAVQAVFVLVELGLSQVTMVVEDEKQIIEIKKLLRQALFQVKFEFITREKVILLPGIYSVIICCEDLKNKQDLFTSILYFNYLEKKGLVINAGAPLEKLPLVEEAQAIGATTVDIPELQIHQEVRALQKVLPITNKEAQQLFLALQKT